MGPAVFKTVEGVTSPLAGSIPVRLRWGGDLGVHENLRGCRPPSMFPVEGITPVPGALSGALLTSALTSGECGESRVGVWVRGGGIARPT